MEIAARVADLAREYRADAVMVDGGGVGAGVVDRLRQLRTLGLFEIQFGGKADRVDMSQSPARYAQKRSEMWGWMRTWLSVGAIPDDPELLAELAGPAFGHNARDEIQLERKEDMRKRGVGSPDCADALACTFAYEVHPHPGAGGSWSRPQVLVDYDVHEDC